MATLASEESSGAPSEQLHRDRHSAYKKLIADLAQHLGKEDVKVIVFRCSLPENMKQSSALDVLDYLCKHAKFSPTNIQPLAELLADAYRSDLVNNYVEEYRLKYGTAKERHSSMPSSANRHLTFSRRAYTCPSSMNEAAGPYFSRFCRTHPPVQETTAGDITPENNPTVDNPHENETVCNHSSTQPQPLSVKSLVQRMEQPQPPTSMNYGHHKTMHQFSDQIQPGVMWSELQKPRGSSSRARHHSESISASIATTPGSVSASSSMHEMNNYHNPGFSEQDSFPGSSAASTNASQDLLSEPHDRIVQYPYPEGGLSNFRSREHSTWYHTHATSSQTSLPSEQALEDLPPQISTRASQYPTDTSLSNEFVPSKFTMHGPNTQVSTTPPPNFHRRTSSSAAAFHSVQTQVHKKTRTAVSSAVSDSGVEIYGYKHRKQSSVGTSTDTIEPWMSVSQDKEQFEQSWLQPRPRVTSVSTGVQTEGEDGSEKTESPASGSPTTSSSLQHPHDGIVMEGEPEKTESPATLSTRTSLHEGSKSCTRGQDTEKQVAIKKSRPRSAKLKLPFSRSKPHDVLKWHVKRSPLNKAIYDHKEQKRFTCKKKLELDAGCGGANPRLVFHLIPYGLEDDAGKSATLEIEVEISRKTRMSMHSATNIRLSVFVQEVKEDGEVLARHDNIEQSVDVSRIFISQFLAHECLKHSRCDQIEIQASAELIPHSEHPHTPTNSK